MTQLKTLCLSVLFATVAGFAASAQQDEAFDLSSQRGEVQEFNKVPGAKLDHKGIIINPTPHSLEYLGGEVNVADGFAVKDRTKSYTSELSFLKQSPKGLKLNINHGSKQAAKAGVKPVSGAYLLEVTPKGVNIVGYDDRGAFYALQTLHQLLESPIAAEGKVPALKIADYPDLPYRGVVEGFYGTPWSHQVRLSLIDYYGRNKMNNYLYGPKDDPYHSSPYWRQPYPADEAKNIHELVEASKRNRVDFIWAIHPGKDIRWNKADYDSLVAKFDMMYELGVRSFAIFFDDIEGEGTNPQKQVELLNALTNDFVKAKGDVTNLIVCPTDYSKLWAKPGPDGPLAVYGRDLDKRVEVFWTGDVVCSDLTPETLDFVNTRIQRPALYWWNYPVTDMCRHILMQGPVYGLDTTLTSAQVAGIESNPMENGEASKLALYGVADYAWNVGAYNPIDNWERGLVDLMPDAADAYRTFAIHSTDTETAYRRDESWETQTFTIDNYTPVQFDALKAEFEKVASARQRIEDGCSNKVLVGELHPWLIEFEKLGKRGLKTLDLIKVYEQGNDPTFWAAYLENQMTPQQREDYMAHRSGTMKLQPFYEDAMDDMLRAFYFRLTGNKPMMLKCVGTYPNLRTNQPKLMWDNDSTTFYTSANSQGAGDWIGVDMGQVRPLYSVRVRQGRNSIDDVDYFDHVVLQASADGKEWTSLTEPLLTTYDIQWAGETIPARYVRIKRLDSSRSNWASVREFEVNPITEERLGLNFEVTGIPSADILTAFDDNPASAVTFADATVASFDRVKDAEQCVLLLGLNAKMVLRQIDAKGRIVETTHIDTPYASVALLPAAVRLQIEGSGAVYEIIQK